MIQLQFTCDRCQKKVETPFDYDLLFDEDARLLPPGWTQFYPRTGPSFFSGKACEYCPTCKAVLRPDLVVK